MAADANNANCGHATCYRRDGDNDQNAGWADACPDVVDANDCSVQHASLAWLAADAPGKGAKGPAEESTVTVATGYADFGPPLFRTGLDGGTTRDIVATEPPTACSPLKNSDLVDGKVALVLRGGCKFWDKALYAQLAGATHVVIYNTPGSEMVGRMVCPVSPTDDGWSIVTPTDGKEYECTQSITIPTFIIDHGVGKKLADSLGNGVGGLELSCVPPDTDTDTDTDTDDKDDIIPPTTVVLCNNKPDPVDSCKDQVEGLCKSAEHGASLSTRCPVLCNLCPKTALSTTTTRPTPPQMTTVKTNSGAPTNPNPTPTTTTTTRNSGNDGENDAQTQQPSTAPATTRAKPKPTGNAADAGNTSGKGGSEAGDGGDEDGETLNIEPDSNTPILKISTTTASPAGDIANNKGAGANSFASIDWTIWGAAVAAGAVLILVVVGYCIWSICKKGDGGDEKTNRFARATVPPASPRNSDVGGGGRSKAGRCDSILVLGPEPGQCRNKQPPLSNRESARGH